MAQNEEDEKPFLIEIAKQGRAVCKKCKQKCNQGELRIAKLTANPFGSGKMKNWHHINCLFELFLKQRPTTKRLEDPDEDLDGWDKLNDDDKNKITERINECNKFFEEKHGVKIVAKKLTERSKDSGLSDSTSTTSIASTSSSNLSHSIKVLKDPLHKDNSFREFRRLVADITNISSYLEKTELVKKMFTKGSDGQGFKGDIVLWCRLLLPGFVKRIYNLQSKQIVKLFSKIFHANHDKMLEDLEQGDVSETIQKFFEQSRALKPAKKSILTLEEVDEFLEELSNLTKEDEQIEHIKSFIKKCTGNDLKVVIRLIKHDLRMNAGAKHILDGVHPDAYEAYQSTRDLSAVINRCLGGNSSNLKASIALMVPFKPMLAEACKSVEQAMKKCPNGMYSEIKYDGERVQVHKKGSEFKYFSRSLKPVLKHKIAHFQDYIPKAFPHGRDLILDSEILMIDTHTGNPLPFGTLGIHKKSEFKDATVCLFVFDCIYLNGEILTDKPVKERKQILKENMTEIKNHIMFAEFEEINNAADLTKMIARVLKEGLEGLVLKDKMSVYEPGKRHWLKVKKDYLLDGAMADSADLIVLGAWYGTGKKGGMMSVFLMGCYDQNSKKFCTVTKVHTGHDDKTLERLQNELDMVKISCDPAKVPSWLRCNKTMIPDFVAKDPMKQPVWEITGAEFTQHDVHTADGISIRFPRVTNIRDDKDWESATSLQELKVLFKNSKEHTDVSMLMKDSDVHNEDAKEKGKKQQATLINFINKQKASPKRKLDDENLGESTPSTSKKIKTNSYINNVNVRNPLPDYFKDIFIVLSDGVAEKYPVLIRYYIAYGGTILKSSSDFNKATHVLHLNKTLDEFQEKLGENVKHVSTAWLNNCIANEAILDTKPYIVYLRP